MKFLVFFYTFFSTRPILRTQGVISSEYSIGYRDETCTDVPGCARAICECDAQFAREHSRTANVWNEDFHQDFGQFHPEHRCRK